MITTMFFVLVTFLDRALRIIIHLARNAEKGGGVLMSITVPKLKHSFIFQVPVPDPDPVPVPVPESGFRISVFSIRPFFSLSFFGKLVLLCKKGKLRTRIKYEKFS